MTAVEGRCDFRLLQCKDVQGLYAVVAKSFGSKPKSGGPRRFQAQHPGLARQACVAIAHDFLEFYSGYLVVFIQRGIGEE